jgi:hypothetical protein
MIRILFSFTNAKKNFSFLISIILILSSSLVFATSSQIDSRPYTFAILPDTQNYLNFVGRSRLHVFESQTRWVADHIIDENIVLAVHLGDIVDISLDVLWIDGTSSLSYINDLVPVVLTSGNHDIFDDSTSPKSSYRLFNKYFPENKFNGLPSFGGVYENGKIENAYYFFDFAEDKYLVLALEVSPRDEVLNWANKIVEKFPNKKVIIVTHAYMAKGPKRLKAGSKVAVQMKELPYAPDHYKYTSKSGWPNDGDVIWERLAKKHKNILFVFSGHSKGPGKLISKGIHGNTVFQVGANYQWEENGGNGYLRLMKFHPKEKKVTVKTYSPLLEHFLSDSENQFLIDLNKGKFLKLDSSPSP